MFFVSNFPQKTLTNIQVSQCQGLESIPKRWFSRCLKPMVWYCFNGVEKLKIKLRKKNCASWELLTLFLFSSREETKSLSVVYESEPCYIYWSSYTQTHTKKTDTFSIVTAIVCFGWKRCLATPFSRIHGEFGRPHPGRALVPLTPWTLWCVDRSCHSFRHGITDWCCLVKMKVAGKDSFMFETWH